SERVLDLVGEAARDFGPGGGPLRLDELRDVIEHEDVAAAGGPRKRRTARMERPAAAFQRELALPAALAALGEDLAHLGCERLELLAEDGVRALVGDGEPQVVVEHQHAGR